MLMAGWGAVEGVVVTVGCVGRAVGLLRGRTNERTYGQGRACINIHFEAARLPPVNIDLHYEHFYWQRHQQPAAVAAECARARKHNGRAE